MNPSERAVAHFMQGYNCAQATAATFASMIGLDAQTVLRLNAGFGAGMGGLRGTCGAVSAMVFVAGAVLGGYAPDDRAAKKALYDKIKLMVARFEERHGTTDCAELLRSAGCVAPPDPSERNASYYARRPCARLVATAAEIVATSLPQAGPGEGG